MTCRVCSVACEQNRPCIFAHQFYFTIRCGPGAHACVRIGASRCASSVPSVEIEYDTIDHARGVLRKVKRDRIRRVTVLSDGLHAPPLGSGLRSCVTKSLASDGKNHEKLGRQGRTSLGDAGGCCFFIRRHPLNHDFRDYLGDNGVGVLLLWRRKVGIFDGRRGRRRRWGRCRAPHVRSCV